MTNHPTPPQRTEHHAQNLANAVEALLLEIYARDGHFGSTTRAHHDALAAYRRDMRGAYEEVVLPHPEKEVDP